MQVITKAEAIKAGMQYYFTGRPCKHGHLGKRNVKYGVCLECARVTAKKIYMDEQRRTEKLEKQKDYRLENKELLKKKYRDFYWENRERLLSEDKKYRDENSQKVKIRHRVYRDKNKIHISIREKKWRAENKELVRAKHANRRARVLKAVGKFSARDVKIIKALQIGKCASCLVKLSRFHIDHINPISKGGSNDKCNIQLLCVTCNLRKSAKDPMEWAKENGRLL